MIHRELASHSSLDVAPRRDAVTAEDAAHRVRVLLLDLGDVEAELESRPTPGDPHHLVAVDRRGELLAVRSGGDRDAGVRVQVVDVRCVHQPVHRGVDRRSRAALAVQGVVEGGDHLVLALDAGVDVDHRAQPVEAEHREPGLGQRAEVATRPLDPEQVDVAAGDRVDVGRLGGGVAARVVGVARVGAEPVGAGDELVDGRVGHQFHPEGVPPTRVSSISFWYPLCAYARSGSAGSPLDSRQAARPGRTSV